MTVGVFLMVLAAAALHVLWNFLVKKSKEKLSFAYVMISAGTVGLLPVLLLCRVGGSVRLAPRVWGWAVLSGSLEGMYLIGVSLAYAHGDLSVVYPLSRGIAPLVTAALAGALVGDALNPFSGLAVAAVAVGAISVSVDSLRAARGNAPNRGRPGLPAARQGRAGGSASPLRGILLALATGCLIAGYHLVDRRVMSMPDRPGTVEYLFLIHLFMAVFVTPWVWLVRGRRKALIGYLRQDREVILIGGVSVMLAYGLILAAFRFGNVTHITAGRNIGILISTLVGGLFLKESVGWKRLTGASLIALGVAGLVLSSHA